MRVLLLMLAACGSSHAAASPPEPLPPNTELACSRAVECGAVDADRFEQCVRCLETVADKWNAEAIAAYGDNPPPVESLPCDLVIDIAKTKNVAKCAAEGWKGP